MAQFFWQKLQSDEVLSNSWRAHQYHFQTSHDVPFRSVLALRGVLGLEMICEPTTVLLSLLALPSGSSFSSPGFPSGQSSSHAEELDD